MASPVHSFTTDDGEREREDDDLDWLSDDEDDRELPLEGKILAQRQQALNSLFGFVPWRGGVAHKPMTAHSRRTRELYQSNSVQKPVPVSVGLLLGKIVWCALFGWWLALGYLVAALLMALTLVGLPFSRLLVRMAVLVVWPFEKFLVSPTVASTSDEMTPLVNTGGRRPRSGVEKVAYALFVVVYSLVCVPLHAVAAFFAWESVVMIPMAKFNFTLVRSMYRRALRLRVVHAPGATDRIELCTYRASNLFFYKYKVMGMNVILVNLLPFVLITIVLGYALPALDVPLNDGLMFGLALIATIPLTYYLGAALASLSAQTNAALGAFFTATFGSLIELILYCTAIMSGGLERLVQASLIGSLLAPLLLLPGLAMVCGGLKFKEQRFNSVSAGVSSVLLITSIVGCFVPTIFYQLFKGYSFDCADCTMTMVNMTEKLMCHACTTFAVQLDEDPMYLNRARYMQYALAGILPLVYIIGCVFTLKTHKHIFDQSFEREGEDKAAGGGHGHAAEWSIKVSFLVLILCTVLFALIAEILTTVVQPVTQGLGVTQTFTGLTLIAVIPNIAELANGVAFALQDSIHLSIEIGMAVATQVALIQMPVLVIFSAIYNHGVGASSFTMIFPMLEVFGVISSVIIINYLGQDGRSNYFHGCALLSIYVILLVAFFFQPEVSFGA